MLERRQEQMTGLVGILGVLLLFGSFFLPGQIHGDESASQMTTLLVVHRSAVLTTICLQMASIFAFFVFLTGLRPILRKTEGEYAGLSALSYATGLIGGALFIASDAVLAGITVKVAKQLQHTDANLVWAFTQVYKVGGYSIDGLLGVFVLATSVTMLRARIVPRWVSWIGIPAGASWILATFSVVDPDGSVGLFGFLGSLLFVLWLFSTGMCLVLRPRPIQTTMQATSPVRG